MFIKSHVIKGIRGSIPECTKVKDFLKAVEEQFVHSDKTMASTLMKRLSHTSYDYSKGVREHIMQIRNTAAQLKTLKVVRYLIFFGFISFSILFLRISVPLRYPTTHIKKNGLLMIS